MFCIDRQGYVVEEDIPLSLVYSLFEGIRIADAYTTSLKKNSVCPTFCISGAYKSDFFLTDVYEHILV